MNGRSLFRLQALSAALLAVSLSATPGGAQGPKVGTEPQPVVLDLVVGGYSGGWAVDLFRDEVAKLSDGQLEIRATTVTSQSEGGTAEQVLSGEADLGQTFARGLDGLGARGFQALVAPFVASDAELQRAIATGPIGADMLAELSDHGLEGLTILPGDRRFVVGLEKPFVSLDDFAGARIDIPETAANFALIRALGAEPADVGWDVREELEAAQVDAVITSINSVGYPDWTLTSNLAPQAVPVVWFASAAVMAELTPEHREILHAAAQVVQDKVLEGFVATESTTLPCAAGARIVAASDEDLAKILVAAQPVIDEMASDPVTASFLDRIATLKAETVPAPFPASCDGTPADAEMSRIPDGRYAATVTHEDALRLGTNPDDCVTPDRSYVITLVIQDGVDWTALLTCGDGPTEVGAQGTFEYDSDTLVMRSPGIPGQAVFRWTADDSQFTLTFLQAVDDIWWNPAETRFIFEHEFTRTPSGAASSSIPDGAYTATVTHEDALRTGFNDGCTTPDRNALVTLVIEGGVNWTQLGACGDGPAEVGSRGTLEYDGDTMVMREPGFPGVVRFAWSADDSRLTLKLLEVSPEDEDAAVLRFLYEHEFTRTPSEAAMSRIPDGTYSTTVTHRDALEQGLKDHCTTPDRSLVDTLVIEGANFTEIQTCGDGPPEIASEGTLEYDGDTLVMRSPGLPGGATFTWSADGSHFALKLIGTVDETAWPPSIMRFLFEREFARTSS